MRLIVLTQPCDLDYDRFKKELDFYPDIYEILYFAQGEGKAAEFCERYAQEVMEYHATPVWNRKGEENINGLSIGALTDSIPKIDKAIWFVPTKHYYAGGTIDATYHQAGKETRFIELNIPVREKISGWDAA